MNIKDYIESGVLESYVIGDLSAAQMKEVEEMAAKYPEVRTEIEQMHVVFEKVAMQRALKPAPEAKRELMDKIFVSDVEATPAPEKDAVILPLREKKRNKLPWMMMAASVVLAIISAVAAANYYAKWQRAEEQLGAAIAQNQRLAMDYDQVNMQFDEMRDALVVVSSPDYDLIKMEGLPVSPESQAIIYWNPDTEDVYLNVQSLPEAPAGKQYQLWAIVEGTPVDAGVFDLPAGVEGLLKMKQIRNASAFAVTLEPRGGRSLPTMDAMFILGTVNKA